ncbi:MAG TPA: response regulator [Candidatus Binatia bacterium]|nr:response regulator [Candidatus Binatia bacterium]
MILLVEDDSLSRRAFAQILRAAGYQVAEAQNGVEALEILTTGAEVLTEETFDLVIADLVLPGLHGVNLIHQIRAKWPKMPIIVISGYLSDGSGKVILEDFAEFVQKPIDPAALIAAVRRLLPVKI